MQPTQQFSGLPPVESFHQLGVSGQLLEQLRRAGFERPTPIQAKAIPIAMQGKDIIGIAQTGTGKTLAFGVPLIKRVMTTQGRAIVLVPTRELAAQVEVMIAQVGRGLGVRSTVIIGGAPMQRQITELKRDPQVIIGTPGRINDHLEHRTLDLRRITIVVLDEADRMLDLGFAPQIRQIMNLMPRERQTLLFSATMPADIVRIAQTYMQLPLRVEIAPAGTTADRVTQELFLVAKEQKPQLLDRLLYDNNGSSLVFTRTKFGAKKLSRILRERGHKAVEIHGNRSLSQRTQALEGFKTGQYQVLVATDIAARGIDVTGIGLVVNYDVPEHAEDYVHRIGRTGRAGLSGHAVTFVEPTQRQKVRDIERLVRASLNFSPLPDLPPVRDAHHLPKTQQQLPTQPQPAVATPSPIHPTWGRQYPHRAGNNQQRPHFRRRRR